MDNADQSKKKDDAREYDVYKDSLVRYFGYTNEVGESFRALVPVSVVRLSYVIASAYVFCDAVHKGHRAWKSVEPSNNNQVQTIQTKYKKAGIGFTDTLIWQGFASVAIPGFTINRICWFSRLCLRRIPVLPPTVRRWTVVALGLGSIPFIIKPIDNGVHVAMDKTFRKLYFDKEDS